MNYDKEKIIHNNIAYILNLIHFREMSSELPQVNAKFQRPILHSETMINGLKYVCFFLRKYRCRYIDG